LSHPRQKLSKNKKSQQILTSTGLVGVAGLLIRARHAAQKTLPVRTGQAVNLRCATVSNHGSHPA